MTMLAIDVDTYPRLAFRAQIAYEKWLAIKEERSRVEKRAEQLKEAMKAEEAIFSTQFDERRLNLRLPGNKLLHCQVIKVPAITHKPYQYNKYSETII